MDLACSGDYQSKQELYEKFSTSILENVRRQVNDGSDRAEVIDAILKGRHKIFVQGRQTAQEVQERLSAPNAVEVLTKIKLNNLSPSLMELLAKRCKDLIDFTYKPLVPQKKISLQLLENLLDNVNIRRFSMRLNGCDETVVTISKLLSHHKFCTYLEELTVGVNHSEELLPIAAYQRLRKLKIGIKRDGKSCLSNFDALLESPKLKKTLTHFGMIHNFKYYEASLYPEFVEKAARCSHLKSLSLNGNWKIEYLPYVDSIKNGLLGLPNLEHLNLKGLKMEEKWCEPIGKMQKLQTLILSSCLALQPNEIAVLLEGKEKLTELSVSDLTRDAFDLVTALPNLSFLKIVGLDLGHRIKKIHDSDLSNHLVKLFLTGNGFGSLSPNDCALISQLKKLQSLVLSNLALGDQEMNALFENGNLVKSLKEFAIFDATITDKSVAHLSSLKVQSLLLARCYVLGKEDFKLLFNSATLKVSLEKLFFSATYFHNSLVPELDFTNLNVFIGVNLIGYSPDGENSLQKWGKKKNVKVYVSGGKSHTGEETAEEFFNLEPAYKPHYGL